MNPGARSTQHPMTHTAISLVRRLALACLLAAVSLGAPCAERLDIDTWPGLAGQPQARSELIADTSGFLPWHIRPARPRSSTRLISSGCAAATPLPDMLMPS
jgi:hypothetical protein